MIVIIAGWWWGPLTCSPSAAPSSRTASPPSRARRSRPSPPRRSLSSASLSSNSPGNHHHRGVCSWIFWDQIMLDSNVVIEGITHLICIIASQEIYICWVWLGNLISRIRLRLGKNNVWRPCHHSLEMTPFPPLALSPALNLYCTPTLSCLGSSEFIFLFSTPSLWLSI